MSVYDRSELDIKLWDECCKCGESIHLNYSDYWIEDNDIYCYECGGNLDEEIMQDIDKWLMVSTIWLRQFRNYKADIGLELMDWQKFEDGIAGIERKDIGVFTSICEPKYDYIH